MVIKNILLDKGLEWIQLKIILYFIVWLIACPVSGQAYLKFHGQFENDRLILGLNEQLLDVPMLLVRHNYGYHQIKWTKQGKRILVSISLVPSESGVLIPPLFRNPKVYFQLLDSFEIIEEKSTSSEYYIDITELFLKTKIRWNIQSAENIDDELSFITNIVNNDEELVVLTKRTIIERGYPKTIEANFSLYILPEPMKTRLFDHRMGFASDGMFSTLNWKMNSEKGCIMRWRMHKKDENLEISPPVKPIVLYLDPEMPEKWKPYVKAGAEEWLPAFEEAGFSKAIEIREVPSDATSDFIFSMANSMIHWATNDNIRGGDGGGSNNWSVTDFRSGEILKTDIYLTNLAQLSRNYFILCAPLDKRARQFPFPDDLMGELIQFVTAHELGHAFGLRDGNYGEFAYPFERMRDTQWLRKMGHVPSIMSYSRHNHIIQPEDSIPPSLLIQRVGPMDYHQIKWGYQPFPLTENPEGETNQLEELIKFQDSFPWYRFTLKTHPAIGPGFTEEVIDNNDPIQSVTLGLLNIKRVMELIPKVSKGQKDISFLETLYNETLNFWYKQMYHVLSMVGGYSVQYRQGNQFDPVYSPIPEAEQLKAVNFLIENAFEIPDWLSEQASNQKFKIANSEDRLLYYQIKLLHEFLEPDRFKRSESIENDLGIRGLRKKVLSILQQGLFKELKEKNFKVDSRRQSLQKSYLLILENALMNKGEINEINNLAGFNQSLYDQSTLSIMMSESMDLKFKINKILIETENPKYLGHWFICSTYLDFLPK